MGPAAFVIVFMAISAVMEMKAAQEQNDALDKANEAAAEQANLDIKELSRQRDFVNTDAASTKAAAVRNAERVEASMLVAMGDMGGAGTSNEARLSGEVGFYEGIDLARIEGNRTREVESLKAKQVFAKNNALNIITQNKAQQKVNTYKFLSSTASKAASAFGGGAGAGATGSLGAGSKGITSSQSSALSTGFSNRDQFSGVY